MYNFDMKQLLKAFDDNPETLATAFADQLNQELDNRKKQQHLNQSADIVADVWNSFVKEYFTYYNVKEDPEEYKLDKDLVLEGMEALINLLPDLEKALNNFEKIASTVDTTKKFVKKSSSDFTKTMEDFFKKYNI